MSFDNTATLSGGNKQRNSSVELLRIFCILLVIAGHYYAHGIAYAMAPFVPENYSGRILVMQLISFGADIANDIFIIITGYYMIYSAVKGKRIIKLIGEMFFYAWVIAMFFYFTGLHVFSADEVKAALFPIWSGDGWYVTCYVILYLLIPFLNPFLEKLEQKMFVRLLVILFVLRFVAPLIETKTFWNTSHGVEQFVFLYMVGAYIRIHGFRTKFLQNPWSFRVLLLVLLGLWAAVTIRTGVLGMRDQDAELLADTVKYYPVFSVLISSVLLIVVLGLKPFYSRLINTFSTSVLGIYLIHDNPLVRNYIWWSVSPNVDQVYTNDLFVHMAKKVIVVFVVCLLIDQCRIWLLEKPIAYMLSEIKNENGQ